MKIKLLLLIFVLQIGSLLGQNEFSFVFLPDTHLRPDSAIEARFDNVVMKINSLHPDFVITGGDMVYTALKVDESKAKVLFDLMDTKFQQLEMPIFYTIGNHELVGVYAESRMETSLPMWGKGMYEKRYGKRYQSFTYSGWKFFLLDGIKILEQERKYTSGVDSLQIEWLKNELSLTDKKMPITIVIHTPLISPHGISSSQRSVFTQNSEYILNLFKNHNLKMVLQGHNHVYMNLLINGVNYISGGSTSLDLDLKPFDDGFIYVKIKNDSEEVKFVHTEGESR